MLWKAVRKFDKKGPAALRSRSFCSFVGPFPIVVTADIIVGESLVFSDGYGAGLGGHFQALTATEPFQLVQGGNTTGEYATISIMYGSNFANRYLLRFRNSVVNDGDIIFFRANTSGLKKK